MNRTAGPSTPLTSSTSGPADRRVERAAGGDRRLDRWRADDSQVGERHLPEAIEGFAVGERHQDRARDGEEARPARRHAGIHDDVVVRPSRGDEHDRPLEPRRRHVCRVRAVEEGPRSGPDDDRLVVIVVDMRTGRQLAAVPFAIGDAQDHCTVQAGVEGEERLLAVRHRHDPAVALEARVAPARRGGWVVDGHAGSSSPMPRSRARR